MVERILAASAAFYRTIQSMQFLAERTGGRAFCNTNDVTTSIRRAVDDSTDHYMLGFYPLEDEWNSKFHNIKVRVNRPGVEVRYRHGFYSLPGSRMSAQDRAVLAMEAAQAPLEIARMTLMVRLDPPPSADAPLHFELVIDPNQIALEPKGSLVKGRLYIAFLQRTDAGKILRVKHETVDLRLAEATYRSALTNGLALPREGALNPGAGQLRIAVCDGLSDSTGSITISLSSSGQEKSSAGFQSAARAAAKTAQLGSRLRAHRRSEQRFSFKNHGLAHDRGCAADPGRNSGPWFTKCPISEAGGIAGRRSCLRRPPQSGSLSRPARLEAATKYPRSAEGARFQLSASAQTTSVCV